MKVMFPPFRSIYRVPLLVFCFLPSSLRAQTLPATITINAAVTVNSFAPISLFGNNAAYWIGETDNMKVQPQVQAAGNYFIRYPGGSSSDDYHWNGTGNGTYTVGGKTGYDANGYWQPSGTIWSYGFVGNETFRGTTSSYGNPSHLTDGNTATTWMSNADTDFSNHQWAELDLSSSAPVNAITIAWGTPYATSFQVQYWPYTGYPPPYSSGRAESTWITAGTFSGSGGTQGFGFPAATAQYWRILMTASSAGAGGAYAIAEATLYNGSTQVSVNNAASTVQTQAEVSSTDPANSPNYTTSPPGSTDFGSFMTYVNSFSPHAIPLITVNFGTGTPSEAASWVNYANNVKGYGIKYWQIGNETEGAWETGGPIPTQDYVRRYIEYDQAMKAVDSTITITGPVAGGFNDSSNMYDGNGVVQDFISILASKGAISDLNAIDYHWYPNYGNYTPASALASTSTLDSYPGQLSGWLNSAGAANPSTVPVLMSEFNVDPSDENFQVQLGNGLWVADALGHFIAAFGSRGFSNLWDTLNGGSATTSATGGDLGYLNVHNDGVSLQYQPHATYWAMQMMTSDWAISADTRSHQLISTTVNGAPASLFAAYADYRPDGVFSLAVINKDPANAYNTRITGLPFTPNSAASAWTFNSSNYQWVTSGGTPYHAAPDNAPTTYAQTGVSSSFPVTFQPYSITVFQFTNSGLPTNTPTITPTITNTPTITATPNYGPATLLDDFEDLSRDGTPPARTDLWGGVWYTYADTAGSSITVQYGATPAAAGNYAARLGGTMASSNEYTGYVGNLSPVWPPTPFNLSGAGILGMQFWIYGDGNTYRMMVENQSVTDFDNYGVEITPPAGRWTFYQVPFSSMVTQGWGTQKSLPPAETGADVTAVQFATQFGGRSYSVMLDNIDFYTAAGVATPTFTPTPSPTATPCGYPGNTCTFTPSSTPTSTPSPTQSPTPTPTSLPKGPVTAAPNILQNGQTRTLFQVPESGATLGVHLYNLAGERTASLQGAGGSSRCLWDSTGTASGLYLARVTVLDPDGSTRQQTLKLVVIH